jgi:hypothetical protein
MSVLDRIKALDAEKAKLLDEAKSEALQAATAAIKTLSELGFHYRLVQDGSPAKGPVVTGGGRRGGVREDVLAVIAGSESGIGRAAILEVMGAKGDKKAEQSISNALANLKKAGTVSADGGLYKTN